MAYISEQSLEKLSVFLDTKDLWAVKGVGKYRGSNTSSAGEVTQTATRLFTLFNKRHIYCRTLEDVRNAEKELRLLISWYKTLPVLDY